MGVLKVPKSKLIEEIELNYGDFVFSDESDYESDASNDNTDPTDAVLSALRDDVKRRRKIREQRMLKKYRKSAGKIGYDGVNLKSNSGAKKRRRVEHAQAILAMADPDDICFDFSDICPPTVTAFSKLLSDKESMAKWQALTEKEADEQERLIEEMDRCCSPSTASEDGFEYVLGGSPMRLPKNYDRLTEAGKRTHHPVHSARARFDRLENRLKSVLSKRRGVPYELLDSVEHRLRDFFTTSPNGVWIDVVENAHTRLYYHAVAGFLNLISSSVFGDSGGKLLEIRNKRPGVFIAPYDYLVPFLHRRQGKSLSFSL